MMMVVTEENFVWETNPFIFIFMFVCCFFSLVLLPTKKSAKPFAPPPSTFSVHHLRRTFIVVYFLASVLEGVWAAFGEAELLHFGLEREQIISVLAVGYGASILFGALSGVFFDSVGYKKACLAFFILHLVVGIWKRIMLHSVILLPTVCLSLATTIFSFSFETWVVVENEKEGQYQDGLNDAFWSMTFVDSGSLIVAQLLVNWLIGNNMENGIASTSTISMFMALIGITCIGKGWKETPQTTIASSCNLSYAHLFWDKKILVLGFAHASLQFSIAVFWILWAPTIVADGREVHLGLIFPCLLGSRMLGSTLFPWLMIDSSLPIRTEDLLVYLFALLGASLSFVAYDYQEIGVLVFLFCLFHAGAGLISPSLARLRNKHVPNELRGGMMSISLAPAHAAILFCLMLRKYESLENSTMLGIAASGLFIAAVCLCFLKRWGKQPYQNWHKT